MHHRALIALLVGLTACGAVAGGPPPGGGSPSPGEQVVTFVVRQGADPAVVGHRIGGPDAAVEPAYSSPHQENLPRVTQARTFVVLVPPEQRQDALRRAQAEPDVQQAYIGVRPGT